MKKRLFAFIVTMGLLGTALTGCNALSLSQNQSSETEEKQDTAEKTSEPAKEEKDDTEAQADKDSGDLYIGFSAMSFDDAYLVETGNTLRALCEERGIEYTEIGADGQAAKQAEQIENLASMGVNKILVTPIDIGALTDVFRRVRSQGCEVIFVGDPLDEQDSFDAAINVDQYQFGYDAAKAAADWIDKTFPDAEDGSIEVAVFVNTMAEPFEKRAGGLKEIEKLTSKAKIVEIYDTTGQTNANAKCQEYADMMFVSHPDVKVVLAHSSDYATAIDEVVLRTNGVDASQFGIFSCDWLAAAAESIKVSGDNQSVIRGLVDSGDLGKSMFDVAVGDSKADENGYFQIPLSTITLENVDEALSSHQ